MLELGKLPQESAGGTVTLAKVAAVDSSGVGLTLWGETAQKKYPRLAAATALSVGDIVVCLKVSGVWVVLDRLA